MSFNFVQHICSMLKTTGQAAVVVPDNVLFEGGAGETIHRKLCLATWDAEQNPEGRWRSYFFEELMARDKTSLDVFWLKDKSLTDLDNLPEPEELAEEIIKDLETGLESFRAVLEELVP